MLFSSLGTPQVPATAEAQRNDGTSQPMIVSACGKLGPKLRRVGWGTYGLHFDVPVKEAQISGGKADVDYVRYVIKPKNGDGYLELWFGPNAFSPGPDKELLLNSVEKQTRDVVNTNGEGIGQDSFGKLETGKVWRHTFVFVAGKNGAQYQAVQASAELFDRIISSACSIPGSALVRSQCRSTLPRNWKS